MPRFERQTLKPIDALPSGVHGYVERMKRYPVLTPEQTNAALALLRNKASLQDLRKHSLFQPRLEAEGRDMLHTGYSGSPVRSYEQLFADSPTIGHLVAFGNFPTLHYFVRSFAARYKDLPLDLEEFMQQALFKIMPDAAQSYAPEIGASFKHYISHTLIWKLDGLVDTCVTHRSVLPRGGYRKEVRPKHDTSRVYIGSLDEALPEHTDNGDPVSLYDITADEHALVPGESLGGDAAIRRLYRLAGITTKEAAVLQTSVLEGEEQEYAATIYGVTTRTIRYRRDNAVEKLRNLGWDTVHGVLQGDA